MKVVRIFVVLAALSAASVAAAAASPAENKAGKDELLALYLLSVAADRCGFAMTGQQADAVERETRLLLEKLKLRSRENDAVYSEADIAFEKQGPAVCDRRGSFAQGFQQTLRRLTGH